MKDSFKKLEIWYYDKVKDCNWRTNIGEFILFF